MCLVDCLWERPGDRKERGGGEGVSYLTGNLFFKINFQANLNIKSFLNKLSRRKFGRGDGVERSTNVLRK